MDCRRASFFFTSYWLARVTGPEQEAVRDGSCSFGSQRRAAPIVTRMKVRLSEPQAQRLGARAAELVVLGFKVKY